MTESQVKGKKLLFEKPIISLLDATVVFRMDCILSSAGSQNFCFYAGKIQQ
jgi:hypothetical protein